MRGVGLIALSPATRHERFFSPKTGPSNAIGGRAAGSWPQPRSRVAPHPKHLLARNVDATTDAINRSTAARSGDRRPIAVARTPSSVAASRTLLKRRPPSAVRRPPVALVLLSRGRRIAEGGWPARSVPLRRAG